MKRICLIVLIAAASCTSAQNKEQVFSMNGLGSLKLGLSQAEVEKLLNEKIVLPNSLDTNSHFYQDTARLKYKDIDVQLEFDRNYYAPYKFRMRLIGIRTSCTLCKTASGIGVGTDRSKILTEFDKYHVRIQPGYVTYYETEKGEGKSTVSVMDDGASLQDGSDAYTTVFYLLNRKVVSFELKAKLTGDR